MKKMISIIAAVFVTTILWAQAPQKMSYQAVIRDAGGLLVINQVIGMEINIHQGSETGTIVYTETQTPTTNANGLASIEIGNGAGFDTIKWGNDSYFIEAKTAVVAPLTTYTITGVTQLLSVPYALNASTSSDTTMWKKNGNNIYRVTGNVGIGTTTPAAKLEVDGTSGTSLKVVDGNQGTGKVLGDDGSGTGNVKWINGPSVHYIGEIYGGGIVFYVYDSGQHGLIAATGDQGNWMRWYAGTYTNTMAFADGVGAGKANTAIIIANQGYGDGATYAARLCNEYTVTIGGVTYGDWYLPSKFELNLLYLQRDLVGGFTIYNYWSSTEGDFNNAWSQYFDDSYQHSYDKYMNGIHVRAIRSF